MRFASLLLCLSACASGPRYAAAVSASARPVAHERAAFIYPGDPSVSETDLEFDEFRSYAAAALVRLGYGIVTDIERLPTNGVVVLLTYGIGDPRTMTSTRSIPELGMVSTGEYTISRSGNAVRVREEQQFGVQGYRTDVRSRTVYDRAFALSAYSAASVAGGSPVAVWEAIVSSSGRSAHLREVVPAMAFLAVRFIGENATADRAVVYRSDEQFRAFLREARSLRASLNR